MPSTVIPTKTGKLFFFFFPFLFPFSFDLCEPKLVGEDLLGREHSASEKRVRRIPANFLDFAEFRRDFVGITVDGLLESLLRAFWEKQITVENILGKSD
jgi:hypothetical protein